MQVLYLDKSKSPMKCTIGASYSSWPASLAVWNFDKNWTKLKIN